MRVLFAVLMLVAATAAAHSTETDPTKCSVLDNVIERLACFDAIFPKKSAAKTEPAPDEKTTATERMAPPQHEWSIREGASDLDDSKEVVAGLEPENVTETGAFPRNMAYLMMRCKENKTSVWVATEMFMMAESPRITVRINKSKPDVQTRAWGRSTDYKAVGLTGKAAINFMKALNKDDSLVIRIEDRDQLEARFMLGDVSAPVTKIATACGWR